MARNDQLNRTVALIGAITILLAPTAGCDHAPGAVESTPSAAAPPKEVIVTEARLEPWPETIRIQGSLLAYEDAVVGSKLAGRIASVSVDLGSIVKRGDPLVSLVRAELDLRVQLAEAQLRQACSAIGIESTDDETQFDYRTAPGAMMELALVNEAESNVNRARQLLASRAVTQEEYDTLVAQLKAAQARYNAALHLVGEQVATIGVRRKELALAQQAIVDSQVVAPFDGIVGARRVSPGEFVQAGQAVVTLVRADRLRFTAGVPESRAASIRVGQRVEIEREPPGTPSLVTSISRVSPTVMPSSRSILIEADVPNPTLELQAGLFVEAEVVVDAASQAIVVPSSAVSRFAGVQKVWIVADGSARQQTVRAGREADGRTEILEGLSAGSTVVRTATEGQDGPVVAVREPAETILQAKFPETSSSARETSSSGAQ